MVRRLVPAVAVLLLVAAAPAPADVAPAGLVREVVDAALPGAAFAITGDVLGDSRPELVVSSFGKVVSGQAPPFGTVGIYALDRKRQWVRTEVVTQADRIAFPNEATLGDIDGDGDTDVVVPSGFFICAFTGSPCGGLAWFEQTPEGWVRHDVVAPGAPLFYHRAVLADLDGDGMRDLVTTGETLASATVMVHAGIPGGFDPVAVPLAQAGGSLPVVEDVDGDGDLDVASAQFFQPGGSFIWIEHLPGGRFGTWVTRTMTAAEGGSIQVARVPGLGWVGTNHTNPTSVPGSAEPGVFRLEPGADPRLPWTAERISEGMVCRANTGVGLQGAPGVFGSGDLDGDGDIDLGVSGDGDPRVFWMEQTDGGWRTRVVAEQMGQAGGGHIGDVDGRKGAELLFTSYEQGLVTLWRLPRH